MVWGRETSAQQRERERGLDKEISTLLCENGRGTHAVQFSEFAGLELPIVCGPLEVTG